MKIFDPKQYGAVGDGRTPDTKAIQAAIDDAAGSGGIVVLEEGRYLTSSLFLGSNMEFHMKGGCPSGNDGRKRVSDLWIPALRESR